MNRSFRVRIITFFGELKISANAVLNFSSNGNLQVVQPSIMTVSYFDPTVTYDD